MRHQSDSRCTKQKRKSHKFLNLFKLPWTIFLLGLFLLCQDSIIEYFNFNFQIRMINFFVLVSCYLSSLIFQNCSYDLKFLIIKILKRKRKQFCLVELLPCRLHNFIRLQSHGIDDFITGIFSTGVAISTPIGMWSHASTFSSSFWPPEFFPLFSLEHFSVKISYNWSI